MKKMLLIMLAVTVSVAMITAATMAWFTDQDTAGTATFTAGTVKVDVSDEVNLGEQDIGNVNPGDTYELKWTIQNDGTKDMVFGVDVNARYTGLKKAKFTEEGIEDIYDEVNGGYDNGIVMKNLRIGFKDVTSSDDPTLKVWNFYDDGEGNNNAELLVTPNWTIVYTGPEVITENDKKYYKDFNNFSIYYTGDPLVGSYNGEPESVDLVLVIEFQGDETHNGYQGSKFHLGGTVTAVQATNGAPAAELNADVYANYN